MMDEKELRILSLLRQDSRMKLSKMSRKIQVPISTIFDRLKNNSNILRNISIINFAEIGFATRAQILIKVKKNDKLALKSYLIKSPWVNTILKINNGFDFIIECIFKHIKDLELFLESIDDQFEVENKQTFYVIDEIQKEAFMSNPELIDIYK